jgi:hypothetical protein
VKALLDVGREADTASQAAVEDYDERCHQVEQTSGKKGYDESALPDTGTVLEHSCTRHGNLNQPGGKATSGT